YLELLRRARLVDTLPEVDAITLAVSDLAQAAAQKKLEEAGSRSGNVRIAIAPGSAYGSAKCWLPERYAAVADGLAGEGNCDVIILGTSAERATAEMIVRSMRRHAINLAGATSVGELPAVLRACHLFI